MITREQIIEKIRILPDRFLSEVNDFIEFLTIKAKKSKNEWQWLVQDSERIYDSDFNNYLKELTDYENLLAQGKVKWK
jgi:hypothetical protein